MRSIYGMTNRRTERNYEIAKLEDFGTLFVSLRHADTTAVVQLLNSAGNVLGLMPHPERAMEEAHGNTDGRKLFEGLLEAVA